MKKTYLDVELRKCAGNTNVTPLKELATKLQRRHASSKHVEGEPVGVRNR